MARNRASARLQSGWNAWAAGSSRATEIERQREGELVDPADAVRDDEAVSIDHALGA